MHPLNNKLRGDGDITSLFERFPDMANMCSLGKKSKIVTAAIFRASQLIYLQDTCPITLSHLARNATKQNEVMIEHHHSSIKRLRHGRVEFQHIRNESIHLSHTITSSDYRIIKNLQ